MALQHSGNLGKYYLKSSGVFLKRMLLNRTGNTDKSNPDMLYTLVKAAFGDVSGSGKMSRRAWRNWNKFSIKIKLSSPCTLEQRSVYERNQRNYSTN